MMGPWRSGRSFDLGRMTFRELLVAYAAHPAILVYAVTGVAAGGLAVLWSTGPAAWWAVVATMLAYPLAWYLIHRFILHSRFLFRSPLTAALWKRIHFDHHQDPHRLDVLFGALSTTLPTILLVTLPLGWLVGGGIAGAAAAASAGMLITCLYEFIHCVQHLNFKPRHRLLRRMKELHLAHHFHHEGGNYGITSFVIDRALGTYYAEAKQRPRSPHAFNLGYDRDAAARFPWVARLTGAPPRDRPPQASGRRNGAA